MGEPLIVIGNGMASTRMIEALTREALGRYDVLVIGAEPCPAYNRVLLSSVLAEEIGEGETILKPARWWQAKGVTAIYGNPVTAIDRAAKTVTLAGGQTHRYAKLVVATGSLPIRLPLPGADMPGVITFRDLADVAAMQAAARSGKRAVVIGGGLLGLEAAHGLAKAGVPVDLVHLMDRLMERQLDHEAASIVAAAMEAKGVRIHLRAESAAIEGQTHVTGLRLKDGRVLPAGLVVMAVGVKPNIALAKASGLDCGRGILVDDVMATSDPDIFAIGECIEHGGRTYGLVEPCHEQAQVLARHLAGKPARYQGSVLATNLKVSGLPVFSAGEIEGGSDCETILLRDRALGLYKKLIIRDGALIGAVLAGDAADGLWYLDLIRDGTPIAPFRDALVFGRALALKAA